MCEDCFTKEISKFDSQADFEKFENILQKKCHEGKVEIIDIGNEQALEAFDSRLYYHCTSCSKNWIMSIPDNAWRGYFLTEAKGSAITKSSKKNKRADHLTVGF